MRTTATMAAITAALTLTVIWQALELRRLQSAHAELTRAVEALSARIEPMALQAETQAVNPPAPPGPSVTEMEPPRGPMPEAIPVGSAPTATDPPIGADVTSETKPAQAPVDRCRSLCDRVLDCALERCSLGTTGTDGLVDACRTRCGEEAAFADAVDGATDCAALLVPARRTLPPLASSCPQ